MPNTYLLAKAFLIRELGRADAAEIVESYLAPDCVLAELTINEIFVRMLTSAQNAHMRAAVIGRAIGGVRNLAPALFDFDPRQVQETFADDSDALLGHIVAIVDPPGAMRTTSGSIWPKYCQTILSAAPFLLQFKDGKDFHAWADRLYSDHRSTAALPLVIASEVDGMGYALACDFLKELGYVNYGKPDIHLKRIFAGIGLCRAAASEYQVQKVICELAAESGVSAFAVDKVFWLIGSGRFYNHRSLGKDGLIGRKRDKFIAEFNAA